MAQIDIYIKTLEEVLVSSNEYPRKSELIEEIVAAFCDSIPTIKNGLSQYRQKQAASEILIPFDNDGDLRKLLAKLRVKKDADEIQLLENPLALVSSEVDKDIERCKNALDSGDESKCKKIINALVRKYEVDIEHIADGLSYFDCYGKVTDVCEDLELLVEKLKQYKNRIALDSSKTDSSLVNIQSIATAENTAIVNLTLNYTVEQIDSLSENVLNEELKKELKLMLLELDGIKGKKKTDAEEIIKKILSWLANQGVTVLIKVIPYIDSILQTLK